MAIAFDAATNGNYTSGTSYTLSHTCGGSDRILHVHAFTNVTTDLITGATYGGVAMTLLQKASNVNDGRYGYLFELVNPATGANNIVISASSTTAIGASAVSHTGVAQTGQPDASTKQVTTSTGEITTSVTTTADNCWSILCFTANNTSAVASTGSTIRATNAVFGNCKMFDSNGPKTPAGTLSMVLTKTGASNGVFLMASFAPVVVASTGSGFFLLSNYV